MRQGRFESKLATDAAELNASIDFDRRLLPYDVEGSKAHAVLSYHEMLLRDGECVRDARRRANRSPLGSGALATTTFPIDRAATASALGFDGVTDNSMDAVGDRDFAVELVAGCALTMAH